MMNYPKVYNKISIRLTPIKLQLAAFKISLVVTPTFAAAENNVPLTECVAKFGVSTAAASSRVLSQ